MEEELKILDLAIECANDDCIIDVTLSSFHDHSGPLIQNSLLDHMFTNYVSLETINENYFINREAFNFLHSKTYFPLYPYILSDQILHLYVNNFQTDTTFWSGFERIQSKYFKNEGHISICCNCNNFPKF